MKKSHYIFIFIFLSGMLFTVFQFVPILEEETPGHRVELTKKIKHSGLEGDDTDPANDDYDNDPEQEFNHFFSESSSYRTDTCSYSSGIDSFYKYLKEQKDTPPPKI